MKRLLAVASILVLLGACYGSSGSDAPGTNAPGADAVGTPEPSPSVTFGRGRVLLAGDGETVLLDVEVAETTEQHLQGLIGRDSLAHDTGMLFVYFEEHMGSYWMHGVGFPVSAAFFDEHGTIVDIIDMDPCPSEDDCPTYTPRKSYRGALEVNQGAFEEWGIEIGDRVTITR